MDLEKVILTDGDEVEIVLAKGTVVIDSNGKASIDAGTYGNSCELFYPESDGTTQSGVQYASNQRHEPTKADKMQQYLYTLFESQKCGHAVHDEIDEALKKLKDITFA